MKEDLYKELRSRMEQHSSEFVFFVFEGISITDPFVDETGRFDVDPVSYYGLERILEALNSK